jgi:hypothetical protein
MRLRLSLASYAAVLVFGLVVGAVLNRPAVGQPQAAQAGGVWRYQMVLEPGQHPTIFVIDTATGQTWINSSRTRDGWQALGELPGR